MHSFLKNISYFCILSVGIIVFFQFGHTQNIPSRLTELITDHSNILSPEAMSGLQDQALTIETNTQAQIAAVLFPTRNGEELYDIGIRLFRESGIGQKEKSNGMLLLIATDEKKLRIMVGYGLEGTFPDIWARTLIESQLRPAVNNGEREKALRLYLEAANQRLIQESSPGVTGETYVFSVRDLTFFLLRLYTTVLSFKIIRKKTKTSFQQISPLLPFLGIFVLAFFTLPGVIGAFFGYIGGIIGGLLLYPHPSSHGSTGGFSYWGGNGGRSSGGFSGGFGGFGGGSTGGGGAGD